ncbi:outer membrane protein assembly factor BamB family protein [Pelomonas sp. BJYL3]|uniref:outer membrane protein assembly factor BamB family protein n=1 Tax=Pelomonas sp. BJYL3 TaxID=2976697 RepID=UPI0022B3CCC9|nr:PQQ-binding-like beta-propeller repeat protein [Pelomonas sp. BJYL3]
MEITAYVGEEQNAYFAARLSKTLTGTVRCGFKDPGGVLASARVGGTVGGDCLALRDDGRLSARTLLSAQAAEGSVQGYLEVRLCRDDPAVCTQPIEGSPWYLPYKVKVLKPSNLSPLQPLPGAFAWSQSWGRASRNADVPASVSALNFNRRWSNRNVTWARMSDGGRIYTNWSLYGGQRELGAFSEQDGARLWGPLQAMDWLSTPAAGNGRIWAVTRVPDLTVNQDRAVLAAFDGTTGQQVRQVLLEDAAPFSPSRTITQSPVLDAGSVYASTTLGQVSRHRESDASKVWSVRPTPGFFGATWGSDYPFSVADGRVAGFDGSTLWALDAGNGATLFTLKLTKAAAAAAVTGTPTAPALGPSGTAYVSMHYAVNPQDLGTGLWAVDLAKGTQRWFTPGVASNAVERAGTVYVAGMDNSLLALDAATGKELWRWNVPLEDAELWPQTSDLKAVLVLVGKLAFVSVGGSATGATYAIDLDSHQPVWRYHQGGDLTVTENGVLLINGAVAINLR